MADILGPAFFSIQLNTKEGIPPVYIFKIRSDLMKKRRIIMLALCMLFAVGILASTMTDANAAVPTYQEVMGVFQLHPPPLTQLGMYHHARTQV